MEADNFWKTSSVGTVCVGIVLTLNVSTVFENKLNLARFSRTICMQPYLVICIQPYLARMHTTIFGGMYTTIFGCMHTTIFWPMNTTIFDCMHTTIFGRMNTTIFGRMHLTMLVSTQSLANWAVEQIVCKRSRLHATVIKC